MKQFFAVIILPFVLSLTNKEKFCNKVLELGVTSKVTSNATVCNILTCFEPSISPMKPVANLTSDLLNCIVSKSGSYYATVFGVYTTMNGCIGSNTLDMLKKMGTALKPLLQPLLDVMKSKLSTWVDKNKLAPAKVYDNWYGWLLSQSNSSFINKCCTKIVNSKNITQKEWTCSKDPSKGGQAFNTKPYDCNTMSVPTGLF